MRHRALSLYMVLCGDGQTHGGCRKACMKHAWSLSIAIFNLVAFRPSTRIFCYSFLMLFCPRES